MAPLNWPRSYTVDISLSIFVVLLAGTARTDAHNINTAVTRAVAGLSEFLSETWVARLRIRDAVTYPTCFEQRIRVREAFVSLTRLCGLGTIRSFSRFGEELFEFLV